MVLRSLYSIYRACVSLHMNVADSSFESWWPQQLCGPSFFNEARSLFFSKILPSLHICRQDSLYVSTAFTF